MKFNSKKSFGKALIVRLTGAVLLLAVLCGFSGCGDSSDEPFDYMAEDLSKYITVDKSLYDGAELKIGLPDVTDLDVEVYILSQLKSKKGSTIYGGEYRYDKVIYPGDKVYIYYRGYEILEDGTKKDLDGTCNFGSNLAELEIGSGKFVPGFELGLVGKIPDDYSNFSKITSGDILDTDVVYLTATYSYETGEMKQASLLRIDLADPKLEEKFGVGIKDYVKSLEYGKTKSEAKTFTLAGSDDKFTLISARLDFITRCEDNPIVVKTVFPYDYSEASFRNKTVYFDVYVRKVLHYDGIMLSDEVITDKLGVKKDDLADYEGDNVTEKYKAMIKEKLIEENAAEREYLAEEALWEKLLKGAVFKSVPKGEVSRVYKEYYNSLKSQYKSYGLETYYPVFADFLVANFELSEGQDPTEYMKSMAESEIKEKLIFYAVVKQEGLIPDEEEYKELYDNLMKEDFDASNEGSGKTYDSEEAYNTAFEKYKAESVTKNGEDYYKEIVYYNYGMEKIVSMAKVVKA